jgi:hypothetical protein
MLCIGRFIHSLNKETKMNTFEIDFYVQMATFKKQSRGARNAKASEIKASSLKRYLHWGNILSSETAKQQQHFSCLDYIERHNTNKSISICFKSSNVDKTITTLFLFLREKLSQCK